MIKNLCEAHAVILNKYASFKACVDSKDNSNPMLVLLEAAYSKIESIPYVSNAYTVTSIDINKLCRLLFDLRCVANKISVNNKQGVEREDLEDITLKRQELIEAVELAMNIIIHEIDRVCADFLADAT